MDRVLPITLVAAGQLLAIVQRSCPSNHPGRGSRSPFGDALGGQRKWLPSPYHAVHEDEFEVVFIKRLVSVPVVGGPDVTGDGCGDARVRIPVTGIGQQGSLVIQQPGEERAGAATCSGQGGKAPGSHPSSRHWRF